VVQLAPWLIIFEGVDAQAGIQQSSVCRRFVKSYQMTLGILQIESIDQLEPLSSLLAAAAAM